MSKQPFGALMANCGSKSSGSIVGVAFLALLLLSTSAEATPVLTGDAYTITFSAETCTTCWGPQVLPDIALEGQLTVAPATGAFWDPSLQIYWGSALMILGISGTIDIDCLGVAGCIGDGSYSLSFLNAIFAGDGWSAPAGDGSYLLFDTPRYVVFNSVGSGLNTRMINNNAYNLFQWASPVTRFGGQVPIVWGTTRVPEPSSLLLLILGLTPAFALNRRRRATEPFASIAPPKPSL
jgi:hypothetical protein